MSTKIQGITISIGGDTSPLEKAFKDINKQLAETEKELRAVEKGLKLSPGNTDLIAQKHKLLGDQLAQTKEKLEKLNAIMSELERRKGLGENVDKDLRATQREASALEASIKNTGNSLAKLDSQMGSTAAQTGSFAAKLQEAGAKVNDLDEKLGGKLTKSIEAMGVAAVAGGVLAAKAYVDFGDEMVKVKTILDTSVMSYDDASKMVLKISDATGLAAGGLANAAYDALSAGVKTKDLSVVLSTAAKTAVAGFTDEATAMDVLTTIMNSYGMEAENVNQISDMLLMTQDKGKVTVGELSQGLGGLVGISSAAGVSLDDVLAAIAALTSNGLPASTSINSVKMAISGMIKPSAEAQTMAQGLGLKFNAQALEAKGLSGMLEDVQRKTGGNTEEMAKLFGSVEALNAVLILTGKGSDAFTSSLQSLSSATGKTDSGFNAIMEESGKQFEVALNSLSNAAIEVGDALSPIIELLAGFMLILAAIDPKIIIVIGSLVMIATVVLQVVKVIKSLSELTGPAGAFFGGINVQAIKTVAIVMGVVAVLIALAAIIAVIIGKGGEVENAMDSIGSSVGNMQNTVNNAQNRPPHHALGTGYHRGGGAIITEYGAEQLTLPGGAQYVVMPRGTRVDSASQTQRLLAGRQVPASYGNIIVNVDHLDDIAHLLRIANNARQSRRQGYVGR